MLSSFKHRHNNHIPITSDERFSKLNRSRSNLSDFIDQILHVFLFIFITSMYQINVNAFI